MGKRIPTGGLNEGIIFRIIFDLFPGGGFLKHFILEGGMIFWAFSFSLEFYFMRSVLSRGNGFIKFSDRGVFINLGYIFIQSFGKPFISHQILFGYFGM